MITLDDYKRMIGKDACALTAEQLAAEYEVAIVLVDFAYKSWLRQRTKKTVDHDKLSAPPCQK